jgi:hypothetical protein
MSSSYTQSISNNKFPLLKLKTNRNSSFNSDASSNGGSYGNTPNSLSYISDINYCDFYDPKSSVKQTSIHRHGLEIDIINYVLNTKSKLDEYYEFVIKICDKDEEWIIYRRYNKFRELHQKWSDSYPVLKRLSFPIRKLMFSRNDKFLQERKNQLEHYLRCFIELLLNDPTCQLNENLLSKTKLCKFCHFFQQNENDLQINRKDSVFKFSNIEQQNSNNLIY